MAIAVGSSGRLSLDLVLLAAFIAGMAAWSSHRKWHTLNEALLMTVCHGDCQQVERHLDRGADPNYRGQDGWTALLWAACKGKKDMVSLLLARGADPNV